MNTLFLPCTRRSLNMLACLSPSTQDERRWSAVLARRSAADGLDGSSDPFLYGVTSTGVVCRPACPSRRPRREHARFFDTLAAAVRAGFRPCLRCCPDGPSHEKTMADRLDRVRLHIDRHLETGPVSLAKLAVVADLSPYHLQRCFVSMMGVSPAEYTRRLRAERFAQALAQPSPSTVTEATYAAGFQSQSRVYAQANAMGMTPGARRRKGVNEQIRYSLADSPLGRMLVAATSQGVCSIAFGDTDVALVTELCERFAAADLHLDDAALNAQVTAVLATLQETPVAMELPLHVRATAFQQRVWKALQAIPRGETRTYAEVAAGLGQPTAARAVARACASNPVAVVVPCHRVVGAGGALTGYRWGVERKRRLLAMERGLGA